MLNSSDTPPTSLDPISGAVNWITDLSFFSFLVLCIVVLVYFIRARITHYEEEISKRDKVNQEAFSLISDMQKSQEGLLNAASSTSQEIKSKVHDCSQSIIMELRSTNSQMERLERSINKSIEDKTSEAVTNAINAILVDKLNKRNGPSEGENNDVH